jgi:hypothetical protein
MPVLVCGCRTLSRAAEVQGFLVPRDNPFKGLLELLRLGCPEQIARITERVGAARKFRAVSHRSVKASFERRDYLLAVSPECCNGFGALLEGRCAVPQVWTVHKESSLAWGGGSQP